MADNSEYYSAARRTEGDVFDTLSSNDFSLGTKLRSSENPAASLLDTIETEILPRLMLVHSDSNTPRKVTAYHSLKDQPDALDQFLDMMIDKSVSSGHEFVDDLVSQGVAIESIYLDLLAPAARRMGELWEEDIRDFTDVTIGLCRLHEVLRHHSLSPTVRQVFPSPNAPSILLTTACGDQHVFGIIMVSEFFLKTGWRVTCEPGAKTDELLRIVSKHTYDVIGISIARSIAIDEISGVIEQVRCSSRNRDIKVILGGALLSREDSIAETVGADAVSTDAATAPGAAMSLLAEARVGC